MGSRSHRWIAFTCGPTTDSVLASADQSAQKRFRLWFSSSHTCVRLKISKEFYRLKVLISAKRGKVLTSFYHRDFTVHLYFFIYHLSSDNYLNRWLRETLLTSSSAGQKKNNQQRHCFSMYYLKGTNHWTTAVILMSVCCPSKQYSWNIYPVIKLVKSYNHKNINAKKSQRKHQNDWGNWKADFWGKICKSLYTFSSVWGVMFMRILDFITEIRRKI